MIESELLEEVIYLSANGKFITPDLLDRIIKKIIDNCNDTTKKQFNGAIIFKENKKEENYNAAYDSMEKEIKIYYMNIIKSGINFKHYNIFETNFYMLQTILHEIEHLKLDTDLSINDFEKKLANLSSLRFIRLLLLKNLNSILKKYEYSIMMELYLAFKTTIFYNKNWSIFPEEKITEANSGKILLNSIDKLSNFKTNNSNEYRFVLDLYYKSLLLGYKYNKKKNLYNVPIFQYLEKLNKIDSKGLVDNTIIEEIKNIENYSIEDRLKYGFPIQSIEVEEVKKKILNRSTF